MNNEQQLTFGLKSRSATSRLTVLTAQYRQGMPVLVSIPLLGQHSFARQRVVGVTPIVATVEGAPVGDAGRVEMLHAAKAFVSKKLSCNSPLRRETLLQGCCAIPHPPL